jgi:hypothetical protein
MPTSEGITFYPELRYKGMRVYPKGWDPDSAEPILRCEKPHLADMNLKGVHVRQAFVERLRADGWHWDDREGGWKYIHVDDLEKVEGPPPDGTF